jgi:phosphoribosylformylglycinamidine synthase
MRARVLVRLKPGIMDVQGAAVKRALAGLGFSELNDLRVGKVIDIELEDALRGDLAEPGSEHMSRQDLEQLATGGIRLHSTANALDDLAPRGAAR